MLQLSFSALSFAPSHFTCPPSLPWLLPCYASTVLPLYPVMLQLSSLFALSFALLCFNCPPSLSYHASTVLPLCRLLPHHASTVPSLCLVFCLVTLQLSSLFALSFALSYFNCPLSLPYLSPCHDSTVLTLCPVFHLVMLQLSSLFALSFTLSCFNCPPSLPCLPVTKIATYHHDLVQAKRKKECCMGPPQKGILTAVTGLYMVTGTAF